MTSASQAAALAAFKSVNKSTDPKDKKFKIPPSNDKLPYIPKSTHKRAGSTQSLPRIKTSTSAKTSPKKANGTSATHAASGAANAAKASMTPKKNNIYDISQINIKSPESKTPKDTEYTSSGVEYFSLPRHSLLRSPESNQPQTQTQLQGSPQEIRRDTTQHTTQEQTRKHNGTMDSRITGTSMTKSPSAKSNLTLDKAKAQDTINALKQSIQAKSLGKDAKEKRISQDYAPQEMLNRIKQSLSDKSNQSRAVDMNKHRDRINEIRHSIDMKRVTTPVKTEFLLDAIDLKRLDTGSSIDSSYENKMINYASSIENVAENRSSTTNGSSMSYSGSNRSDQPAIVINEDEFVDFDDGEEYISDEESDSSNINDDLIQEPLEEPQFRQQNRSNEAFQRPITPIISHASTASPVSPIAIPPSQGASAREANLGSSESLHLNPNRPKLASFDSAYTSTDSFKSKPKRKPPPTMGDSSTAVENDTDLESNNHLNPQMFTDSGSRRSSGDFGSNSGSEDFTDQKSEATTKLPQFPGLDHKQHTSYNKEYTRNLFKKKNKIMNIDLRSLDKSVDPLSTPSSSRPGTPLLSHQTQPVQLKTTMRKAQKKKIFNEDKPWKNHTDLSFVTEGERKRYEGLWTSNKGLYISNVVTKLKGVKYDSNDEIAPEQSITQTNASTRAAQLSSKTNHEITNINDFNQFHNLDNATTDNLMVGPVVKRIWNRSKLPEETLEQIWNLVDYRNDGTLNKHEFVVGMWLVDQCLYGRKLPKKVDNEVWGSLESIGLNVVIRKRNKRNAQ